METINVGDRVIVMDELKTVITRIEGDKYYFNDQDGREWHECRESIEKLRKINSKRTDLICSREYWVALIHINLWNANGSIEEDSDKYEEMAEKVVNEMFMNNIMELNDGNSD